MNITTTDFEYNYHNSQWRNGREYLTHNADIYNTIQFKDLELQAVYQDAQSYFYGDYSQPRNVPELVSGMGTDKILNIINSMYEKDFDNDEYIANYIEQIDNEAITTKEELRALYEALRDNNSAAIPFYNDLFDDEFKYDILEY